MDLIGPFHAKTYSKGRARQKVWSLIILCKATGLMTPQLFDTISLPDVIKGLWSHQARHNCAITSIHSDSGTQLRHVGDLGHLPEGGVGNALIDITENAKH